MKKERREALMRIPIGIVSGIVIGLWAYFVFVLGVINFFYTIFKAKRMKNLAEMSETWNSQQYVFYRYMIFESNQRPFPFKPLQKKMSKFQK